MHGYGFDMMSGWGGMWLGPILMFLIPVAIVVLIIWLIRAAARSGTPKCSNTVRELPDDRYARGEIDDEAYKLRRSAHEH